METMTYNELLSRAQANAFTDSHYEKRGMLLPRPLRIMIDIAYKSELRFLPTDSKEDVMLAARLLMFFEQCEASNEERFLFVVTMWWNTQQCANRLAAIFDQFNGLDSSFSTPTYALKTVITQPRYVFPTEGCPE